MQSTCFAYIIRVELQKVCSRPAKSHLRVQFPLNPTKQICLPAFFSARDGLVCCSSEAEYPLAQAIVKLAISNNLALLSLASLRSWQLLTKQETKQAHKEVGYAILYRLHPFAGLPCKPCNGKINQLQLHCLNNRGFARL